MFKFSSSIQEVFGRLIKMKIKIDKKLKDRGTAMQIKEKINEAKKNGSLDYMLPHQDGARIRTCLSCGQQKGEYYLNKIEDYAVCNDCYNDLTVKRCPHCDGKLL